MPGPLLHPSTEREVPRSAHSCPTLLGHRWPPWEPESRLHSLPHAHTLAHPGCGAAEGLKREALGERRASTGLDCGLGRSFPPASWIPGRVSTSLRWPRQDSWARAGRDAQCPAPGAGSQQGAAAAAGLHGHQQHPQVARSVGRVADGVDLLQPRAAQQAGAVVGEGVEGELTVACECVYALAEFAISRVHASK